MCLFRTDFGVSERISLRSCFTFSVLSLIRQSQLGFIRIEVANPFLPPPKILSSAVKFFILNYFTSNISYFAADYHSSSFMSLHFHRSLFLNAQICDWITSAFVEYWYIVFLENENEQFP